LWNGHFSTLLKSKTYNSYNYENLHTFLYQNLKPIKGIIKDLLFAPYNAKEFLKILNCHLEI
ncbi:MAG: hypothetical protein K2Q34_05135, partial [Alphaproteobacteria bacterium]|nr:hypothetical protein [Alphaproteobacteria bacterium]